MKSGWYYNENARTIQHQRRPEDTALVIGYVPQIVATIEHFTDDGEYIRTEYLALGKRQRRPRILSEDELDRGTWAAKMGARRPTGNDERHAFARLIREEGDKAPVIPARTYYNEAGDLVFPEADAQTIGYRVLRGDEKKAREAWDEIGYWTQECGKSSLVAGAMFVGPVLDSLDALAHMVNCYGPGQQGKSTILTVCAGAYGDIKPRRQQIMIPWNSSKQGITQTLRARGFLPICLDEHSSSGRKIQESSREISQMVAGAIRAMGTADGSPRESDGFWLSVAVSSSNEPLKHEGQTEDLATRLQEFKAPFFPNKMLLADGSPAPEGHPGAEHVSKRLKRLAKEYGGWPLEWAIRKGMYRTQNLEQIRKLYLELCAKHRPAQGGIAATIAELHMAWVVGAHMLGEAIGVPEVGKAAEREAAARLQAAIVVAAEANVSDHEKLWSALDALRIEKSAFPDRDKLPSAAEEGFRRLRGFIDPDKNEWWVIDPVVREAASQAGIDNVTSALKELNLLGIHIRGAGKHAQRKLPRSLQEYGLGIRMHCFDTAKAAETFAPEDGSEDDPQGGPGEEFPGGTTPRDHPETGGVVPENSALTCDGTTGTTGTTLSLFDFSKESGTTPGTTALDAGADGVADSGAHDVTSTQAPAYGVPEVEDRPDGRVSVTVEGPVYPKAVPEVTDAAFAELVDKAQGRTISATRFAVLGAEGDQGRLYLPNHQPVRVVLPTGVDDVRELLAAYGLKTLWVHESAALGMGLPTYEERFGGDVREYKGPQGSTPHPWATPREGSDLVVQGEGLSCWVTLKTNHGQGKHERLSIALPLYEDRFDRADEERRGGWGGAATPEILLDALMVYLVASQHGTKTVSVAPYYLGPNTTAKDYAACKEADVVSEMIRNRAVPPVHAMPPILDMQWSRPADQITPEERSALWLHQFDKNAAWLGAFGGAKLGLGDPVHHPDGVPFDTEKAGYWRVADIPGTGLDRLPGFRVLAAEEGGFWLRTPAIDLIAETYKGWTPTVLEAWVWPATSRALYSMYERISTARKRIILAGEQGRPGARYAKQVVGALYQSFRGYLTRVDGPQKDNATGGHFAGDIYWRPDWAAMILDLALANTYRNLRKYAAEGRFPLSLRVDAITLTSNEADPAAAAPASMDLGNGGRQWKGEARVPFAEVLPAIDNGAKVPKALDAYLTAHTKEA
ncbi:DUF927 domain-containing protein [Streptomyces ipomoeae]|uniref:DUF927 domain-containing protein n=1 Tax=Streptomyces ipomoeae TaxID=103232 RepID=UPI0029AAFF45|nr:DUF927 domain-containing protein [Streptomyces ipomoeae]MDX2843380.1 DUF927 domain-containing protein [Streptomyces ipomoeae]